MTASAIADLYSRTDATGLADLVRRRELSSRELVEEAIRRIEAGNSRLNAVTLKCYDSARAAADAIDAGRAPADGPFRGVPFLVKDLCSNIAGLPTSGGSAMLRDIPMAADTTMVERWRAAGLVIVGRTNTPELGLMPVTEPRLFGPTHNPWDLSRTPGGSSGGSAAAVAARFVPIASGNDGGGSIRIPASCCGLVGLKPSRGRTPIGPPFGELWGGLVAEHVLTRSVRDCAAALDATCGDDAGAPYAAPHRARPFLDELRIDPGMLRIAFTTKPLFRRPKLHADCEAGLRRTAGVLRELGHQVEEVHPALDGDALAHDFQVMLLAQTRAAVRAACALANVAPRFGLFEPTTWAMTLLGKGIGSSDYIEAQTRLQIAGRQLGTFFERHDVLLTSTLATPPIRTGALQPTAIEALLLQIVGRLGAGWLLRAGGVVEQMADKVFGFMPNTALFNATGLPAISLPLHQDAAGLPIGMQFAAGFGNEAVLLRLAAQLEEAMPWRDRPAPAHV